MRTIGGSGREPLLAAAVLFWLGTGVVAHGQALDDQTRQAAPGPLASYTPLDQESYDRVLDLIFPVQPKIKKGIVFTMSVRFLPAFDPEAQILVTFFQGKAPSVTYTVADTQAFARANRMPWSGGKPEPAKIAKEIAVKGRDIEVAPERVLGWQQGLFRSLSDSFLPLRRESEDLYRNGTVRLLLDGPMYEVRYAQFSADLSCRFSQTVEGLAIAQWAESLRSEVENTKAQ